MPFRRKHDTQKLSEKQKRPFATTASQNNSRPVRGQKMIVPTQRREVLCHLCPLILDKDVPRQKPVGLKQANAGSADQVVRLLNEVRNYQEKYTKLVETENHAVENSRTMEVMALETVQDLEEVRNPELFATTHLVPVTHFGPSRTGFIFLSRRSSGFFMLKKGALDNMTLVATDEDTDAISNQDDVVSKNKKANVFQNFLTKNAFSQQDSLDEGVGAMEADTLGLPEEIGILRDEVRSSVAVRSLRVQTNQGSCSSIGRNIRRQVRHWHLGSTPSWGRKAMGTKGKTRMM